MAWTLCTSGSAILSAGAAANTAIIASGSLELWSDEAEGRVDSETRQTWVTSFSGVDTATKNMLSDVTASLIAMKIISYDTTGYLTREADTLLNVLDDRVNDGLKILKDWKKPQAPK